MKAKKKKISSVYIFPVLFFIICLSYTIRFLFFNIETEIVKFDSVENSIKTDALIVRTEWVQTLPAGVQVNYKVNEGEKVAVGRKILEIVKNDSADDNMAIKIKQLEERIKEIKQADINNNFFSQDKEKIEKNISDGISELKQIVKSGDYRELETVKADLVANQYKKSLIYGTGSFFGKNLEQLEKEKEALENIYNNNIDEIYAQHTGIVSYETDGYEQLLNPANLKDFKLKDIKELMDDVEPRAQDNKNEGGVKVVNNFEWYVVSIVNEKDIEGVKVGKKIKLRFAELGGEVLNGEIQVISEAEEGEKLIAIKINEYLKDFHKKRTTRIEIIKDYYEGFLVPAESIVQKDNISGVYVIKSGKVKFVPVTVMATFEDKNLVRNMSEEDEGYKPGYDVLKNYDEVITTTERVKENQVLTDKI